MIRFPAHPQLNCKSIGNGPSLLAILLLLLIGSSGCTQTASIREMFTKSFDSSKPSHHDYDDGTDETDEGWIKEAGIEARGDRPLESENDPFRDLLMSPKARSIERNLGFE